MTLKCPECESEIIVSGLSKHIKCSNCFAKLEGRFKGCIWVALGLSIVMDLVLMNFFISIGLLLSKILDLAIFLLLVAILSNIFGDIEVDKTSTASE